MNMTCRGCGEVMKETLGRGFCTACHRVPVFRGYARRDLFEAFEMVQSENWKMPVDKVLPRELSMAERDVVEAAVVFYTASKPKFEALPGHLLRVTAAGYYNAVGA